MYHRISNIGDTSSGFLHFDLGLLRRKSKKTACNLPQYCLNCWNFGRSILRKIIKIAATRCHILKLKCTKFNFVWGSAPDPASGAYSAPPYPLAEFKRAYF